MTSAELIAMLNEKGLDMTTIARRSGIPIGDAARIFTEEREPTKREADALRVELERVP